MVKKITVYIINFIITILILSLTILLILNNTVLNKQYVKEILQKNDYYSQISSIIQKDFKNNILQSGLEEDVLENLYSKEKVDNDINMVLDAIYENKKIDIDTSTIKQTLDDRINAILEENNRKPGSDEREEIEIFEKAITDAYVNEIVYAEKYVDQISSAYSILQKIILIAEITLGVLVAIFIITIILITKNIKDTIRSIGTSLFSVGMIQIIFKIIVGNRVRNILILNNAFSKSLIDLINSTVNTIFVVGIIMSILGIVGIIVGNIKNRKIL